VFAVTEELTLSALAKRLGRAKSSLSALAKQGVIPRNPSGKFNEAAVRAAMASNLDPARTKPLLPVRGAVREAENVRSAIRTEADASAAVGLIRNVLRAEGHAGADGAIDYADARTADTILKAHERDLKMARLRKEQVPIKHVRPHIEKAFHGYKQAVLRIPDRFAAEMAAALDCDETQLANALARVIRIVLDELSAPIVRA
jgi:hypothetical protein